MRIDQYFVSALTETGAGLPPDVADGVRNVLCGPHKTFRYMLFTGLLAAVSDKSLHPRCLQVNAGVPGAFDARSLCQKVVVPFEKKMLNGRLGASNEPFANKSARFDMIRKTNNVRKGADQKALFMLYDVLEFVRTANEEVRVKTFKYALSVILKLPPNKSSVTVLPPITGADIGVDAFFSFFESRTKGVSAVATLAAAYRFLYTKPMKMKVHPATESGASSKEVGDIDVASMGGNKTPIIDTRLLRNPDSPDWLKRLHARASKGEDISGVKVPSFMRRITVSEAAALQGFPMDFKFLGSRCDKYRQIGNSVPPPLAEAIAMEVVKAMLKTDR